MVKTKDGQVVNCRYCESDRLVVYCVDSDGTVWLECTVCGAIYPIYKS